MSNIKIEYELSDKQQKMYNEWTKSIKLIHGEVGTITWEITSYGIGCGVVACSKLTNTKLDLTDVDSW